MLLEVRNLKAGYGKKQVLFGISLHVQEGEIVALIGHNGAGKSTILKSVFGLLTPTGGEVIYRNQDVTLAPPAMKLEGGIYHIPQEHFLFNDLTVRENLEMGFFTMKDQSAFAPRLEAVHEIFPVLKNRQGQPAGTLSGGERRMLGIGMGLMRHPQLMMLDEPSSGLSPVIFQNVIKTIQEINKSRGTAILLVEQNVKVAFRISARAYVMKAGYMILEETGEKLLQRSGWWDLF